MTAQELYSVTTTLHRYYGDKFSMLNNGMAERWFEDLRHIPVDVARLAVRRWSGVCTFKAPSLEELLNLCETIQAEQRRAHTHQRPLGEEPGTGDPDLNKEQVRQLLASIWPEYGTSAEETEDPETRRQRIIEQGRDIAGEQTDAS